MLVQMFLRLDRSCYSLKFNQIINLLYNEQILYPKRFLINICEGDKRLHLCMGSLYREVLLYTEVVFQNKC